MSPAAVIELKKLMERVGKARGLRNQIAHCTWMPGRKSPAAPAVKWEAEEDWGRRANRG